MTPRPVSSRPRGALATAVASDVPGALAGARLASWDLVSFVGRGGMADVYGARRADVPNGGRAAVKLMLPRVARQPALVELFLHEARISALFDHPNLARCVDFGVVGGAPFMVLEQVDGIPLDAIMRFMSGRGAIGPRIALSIVRGVVRALGFAHALADEHGIPLGVVHQDVSPGNVLLDHRGRVKLIDFGVAKSALHASAPPRTRLRGKLGYMSPEQIAGLCTDARSDLFSAGVLVAELLLGERLFKGSSELDVLVKNHEVESDALGDLAGEVTPPTARLLRQALARDRDGRFRTAAELGRALEEALGAEGEPMDAADVVAWLAAHGFSPSSSGVYDAPARGESGRHISAKIDELRSSLSSFDPPPPSTAPVSSGSEAHHAPPRYHVKRSDSAVVDTLCFADLLERVATGRCGADTPVAEVGSPFRSIRQLPELGFVARLNAYRFDDGSERHAGFRSPLLRARLPQLLFALAERRARGLLTVRTGSHHARIFFEDGAPCFAASSDKATLLGQRLVDEGRLGQGELAPALYMACKQGRHLGEVLVATRRAAASEIIDRLVSQLESRVLALAALSDGEVSFCARLRPGLLGPRPLGHPATLAHHMVRHCYTARDVDEFLAPLADAPILAVRADACDFGPANAEVRSLAELARGGDQWSLTRALAASGRARAEIRTHIFLGLSMGWLVSPGWPRQVF
jgi:eukaryotic-like serine/threonine-protein kinase